MLKGFNVMISSDNDAEGTSQGSSSQVNAIRKLSAYAAIASTLLLYFGYTSTWADFTSAKLMEITLKGGGVVMVVSTLLLLTGQLFALVFDGVVSIAIGAALAASGLLFLAEARAIDAMIIGELLFGYFFISSGRRSLVDFKRYTFLASPDAPAQDGFSIRTTCGVPESPPADCGSREPRALESHADVASEAPDGYLSSFAPKQEDERPNSSGT